ncbi:MAG: carboxypeptidase regulatory-like domain-containing protein [Sandaracinaceae bacterium]|nr:carboxypeptidase regulatory-like domain-containing protein [Sandaracinaceae bacterium]
MTNPAPTPAPRRSALWRLGTLAWVALSALLLRDATAGAPLVPTPVAAAPAVPAPPSIPAAPFRVILQAPPTAEGAPRALVGSLLVETDEGERVREIEVHDALVAIDDVRAGPYVLRAQIAGFARLARAIRTPCDDVTMTLTPIARVSGQLQGPDGQPHAGTLRIVGSGIWPGRELVADAEGRFVFEDVPPGVYEVQASSDTLVAEPRRGLTVDPEASVFVQLRLAEGGFVDGEVVDRRGRPIAAAEVVASTASLSTSAHAALSDAAGRFRVGPFEPGSVSVDVRAGGFVSAVAEGCSTDAPCRVILSEGAVLEGRVLDEAHEPIADAWVEVVGDASDHAPIAVSATVQPIASLLFSAPAPVDSALPALPTLPSLDPALPESMPGLGVTDEVPPIPLTEGEIAEVSLSPGGTGASTPAPSSTTAASTSVRRTSLRTDAQGAFVVSGLPPGRVEVIARAPGYRAARSPRLQLTAGRARENVELVLSPGGSVAGTVLDEHGRPADARVEARIENDPIPRYLATDARGRFRLDDVGGTVLLLVTADGRPAVEHILDVHGGGTEDVSVTLDAGRRVVRARVLDPQGDPLEDALVRMESLRAGTGQPRTLVTDANGEVEITAAPPGALALEASHPSYVGPRVIASGDDTVVLTMNRPLDVVTTLLDAWTGAAVGDAEITWTCLDGDPCFRTTASTADGVVELRRARAARYRVEIRPRGYAPFVRDLEIRAPRRGDVVELDPFVVEPGLRVQGDVVDRFGRAVEGAEVTLGEADARDAIATTTDERGHFELGGVPSGRRVVHAVHASAGEAAHRLEVRRDRDPAPFVLHLPERVDDDPAHGDRARRVVGVGIALERDGERLIVSRVIARGARRAGLVRGDELLAIDGVPVRDLDAPDRALLGASFLPALLELRRDGARRFVRAPHELHD